MKCKKFLMPFLLCSILFFSSIPKTYADSIPSQNFLIDANLYNASLEFQSEVLNAQSVSVPKYQFPVFFGFQLNELNFSKACDLEFGYRVDYSLFGWHNYQQNLNWVNYAKLINVNNSDIETIGTIITKVNNYTLNFSTFFIWRPSYCPIDTINSLNFRIDDNVRFPLNQNYFYSETDYWNGGYYYVFDALFEQVNIQTAQKLVDEYYDTGSITQEKLDNISGQLVHVNTKLDETNEKLDELYQGVGETNEKLDDINDFLNDSNLNTDSLENSAGWLPPGPVDSILNLPLSLYENLLDILTDGTSCPALNINIPFINENMTIPCLSDIFSQIEGLSTFWTWVGTISGAFLLFNYLIHLYKWVDDTLTLRENTHFGGY